MSLAIINSRAQLGLDAPLVRVEVHLSSGLPSLSLVGLPETAVRESKDRVRSAIINSDLSFPQKRITLSLAPADLPKDGSRYDLAIATALLAASGQVLPEQLPQLELLGELGLSGQVRPVREYCRQHWLHARRDTAWWCPQPTPKKPHWSPA